MSEIVNKVQGVVQWIGEDCQVSEKTKKRSVLVATSGNYPQDLLITAINAKTSIFDALEKGAECIFHININGRKWVKDSKTQTDNFGNPRVFMDLTCWKVDILTNVDDAGGTPFVDQNQVFEDTHAEDDDMPF